MTAFNTTITVRTPSVSYDVEIGAGLLASVGERVDELLADGVSAGKLRVFVVTSSEIWRLWGDQLSAGFRCPLTLLNVEPGERYKNLTEVERLAEELAHYGADRDSILIAFGGGVIGDMTGFLAAIYMRGIRYVQVPTTLLAQVDSSIGGKTGVNLAAGKNLVGAFHHPLAVYADTLTLGTLPAAELRAGLQESVKAGIIRDGALFGMLEHDSAAVLNGDCEVLSHVVAASIRVKADIVNADERESGVRMILNLGHTLGHAIEAATEYKQLLHGEAVAWGMIAAIGIAVRRGMINAAEADQMERVIRIYGPLRSFTANANELVALTAKDKKNRGGTRSFVLPVRIGEAVIVRDVSEAELFQAATSIIAGSKNGRSDRVSPGVDEQSSSGARPANEASEADAAEHVREIFDSIAPSYDLLNHLLSVGLDRRWWSRAARCFWDVLERPQAQVLDLCCGTGDMTAALLAQRPVSAKPVTGLDFSAKMLDRARVKYSTANALWVEGDAMHLPYADGSFDLVMSAFGFRNLTNYTQGLAEIYRVLSPGGKIGILECNQPDGLSGFYYGIYFRYVLPLLGGWISGDRAAYAYLPASVARFPRPPQMLQMMLETGFVDCTWDGYLLRAAGLYRGVKVT